MKVYRQGEDGYQAFCQTLDRRSVPSENLYTTVADILNEVKHNGDSALLNFAQKFDGATFSEAEMFVTEEEFAAAEKQVSESVKQAIRATHTNIHAFAERSVRQDWSFKNAQGAEVGERFRPFDRVGVYVPGGKAPLVSTVLMTAGFAQAVGVKEIIAATPVGNSGTVLPELLYAMKVCGVTEVLKFGGAQAIAAMGLGTSKVRSVEKIFGPGNRFVVEAKRQLVGAVAIDLLPGPSEILVIADDTANASFIAADLLAQAEHGGDSVIGFFTPSEALLHSVQEEITKQLNSLNRAEYISEVLEKNAFALLVKDTSEAIQYCNDFAPEHLSFIVEGQEQLLEEIKTAGAIYVGNHSTVAVGDFLAGPSHTLPTGGSGKSFSGIRADQFQRRTSIVRMDQDALRESLPYVEEFSKIEGLDAHGASAKIRA